MGATKTDQYDIDTLLMAKIASALGHPARMKIVECLKENPTIRNVDFQKILGLSGPTVHVHLNKLKSAKLVSFKYSPHEYHIKLRMNKLSDLNAFLGK